MSIMDRDLSFEALCVACGIDFAEITKDQRGRVNAALKQLRSVYPDDVTLPDMIRGRAQAWAIVYPEIPLTPQALTNNWSSILAAAEQIEERKRETDKEKRKLVNAPMTGTTCICGGDKVVVVGTNEGGHDITAPCPECNPHANAEYWSSYERRTIKPMDSAQVREFLSR